MKVYSNLLQVNWPESIVFRQVKHTDLPALEWDGEYKHLRNVYKSAYERQLKGRSKLWIAELQNFGLIGQVFIQLFSTRVDLANGTDRAYLYAFRIKEPFRNSGLGTRLLNLVEQDLFNEHFLEVTLNVAKDNPKAIHFYQKNGYKIVSEETGEWSYRDHNDVIRLVTEPAWKMIKKLN